MPFAPARPVIHAALLGVAIASTAGAQHEQHGEPATTTRPAGVMPLYRDALGPFTRRASITSPEVQGYFDQGFQLLYSFAPDQAVRSFREAQRRDSACAVCAWGEAWALGPYLNGAMNAADVPRAYAAIQRAVSLAPGRTTPVERAMIDAMKLRYEATHDSTRRRQLDTAYAKAMAGVYATYPRDAEVATLYAESLMLLEPRRGNWDIRRPEIRRIHEVLESVLTRDRGHPGACHLYIHATESTPVPAKAEACAEVLGSSIPGASHINHMPSHTFNRVGRWGDAVRANLAAWHSDLRSAARGGGGFAVYPAHNLHMLLFSASMGGEGAIAAQAAKDYTKLVPSGVFYQALVFVRFGRFDEVLALERPPADPIERGLWEFARGYAHLRIGDADTARAYLERVERGARTIADSTTFRGHTAAQLLGVTGGILRGELLRREGKPDDAIRVFEEAVALEDKLRYDEPEPLNFSARDWLGAALLEAKRPADAEQVYRAALDDHPNTGWSLIGLEQALRAQGRDAEATAARRAFDAAWARSDTWIRASRF
jgi:tetratricopeptide (TPR) repeat protein